MGLEHQGPRGDRRSAARRGLRFVFTLLAAGACGILAVQCSASSNKSNAYPGSGSGATGSGGGGNGFDASGTGASGGQPNIGNLDAAGGGEKVSQDQYYLNDPPPANCSDAGVKPPVITGTPQCPSDKNNPGCPCPSAGTTAPCWPGLRKYRNLGACKDGTTTCQLSGENELVWGACKGMTGIDPTTYKILSPGTCGCFSSGTWAIANTSPCFVFTDNTYTNASGAVSTVMTGDAGQAQCPSPVTSKPNSPWSTDTVKADCAGYFKLCYTLKAYSDTTQKPSSNDCVLKQVCSAARYDKANQTQTFPPLPAWITSDASEKSCAEAFVKNGGYAEMSVDGESDECEKVQKVFATVTYCPPVCNDPNSTNKPAICSQCTNGGSGNF